MADLTRLEMIRAMCETSAEVGNCLAALRRGELTTSDVREAYDQHRRRRYGVELTPSQQHVLDGLAMRYPSVKVEHCPRVDVLPESVMLTPCVECGCDPDAPDPCPQCGDDTVVPTDVRVRVYPGGLTVERPRR